MSVSTIKTILLLRAPDKSTETRLDALIALVMPQISETVMRDRYDLACALLVLHWLAKEISGGGSGAIVSEHEGDLSRSYATTSDPGDLDSTKWGLELKGLQKKQVMPFMVRGM